MSLVCRHVQDLLPALRSVEEEKDDMKGTPLRWAYCFYMLQAGSRPGHIVTVSHFLDHVLEVRAHHAYDGHHIAT